MRFVVGGLGDLRLTAANDAGPLDGFGGVSAIGEESIAIAVGAVGGDRQLFGL